MINKNGKEKKANRKEINRKEVNKISLFPRGKKAMMDDLFDLFYTLAVSILLLFFINAALSGGIDQSNKKSVSKLEEFKLVSSAVANLKVYLYEGGDLKDKDLDQMVARSKILGGRTITTCSDYLYEPDCTADPLKVSGDSRCIWLDDSCKVINI
ncbi:MAG: hypothetical protein KKA62_05660 [Nanoarchaeota archaeon]|nr:hypothetical protein [Nanoarchaeota archaeon]MBU1644697.1 hypothetical protein [Nanoarchaeota archaeon]MBU1977410.1 hypothetical protein [Nanoarchaeota archaeon]